VRQGQGEERQGGGAGCVEGGIDEEGGGYEGSGGDAANLERETQSKDCGAGRKRMRDQ
jgi:hypothetical protein